MLKLVLLAATVCGSLVNGAPASPLFDPVLFLLKPALAPLPLGSDALFYGCSVFISIATLMLSGVPAAFYERARGRSQSSVGSLAIWLMATLLLAIPGALGVAGFYEFD